MTETKKAAITGAVVWVVWALVVRPDRAPLLLMISPLVLVPLALGLVDRATVPGTLPPLDRISAAVLPVATIAATSFAFDPGGPAALLTVPWLALTAGLALLGVLRLGSRPTAADPMMGVDLGMIFVLVGGVWLTISRAGLDPGYGEAIVELTAVHFHYAGLVLPIVAGIVGAQLGHSWRPVVAVAAGIVATAIGITAGGVIELVGATFMAGAGLVVAGQLLMLVARHRRRIDSLLGVAGLSLGIGMGFALAYAWTTYLQVSGPGIDFMVATHGSLNAIGFGLLALLALTFADRPLDRLDVLLAVGRPGADRLVELHRRTAADPTANDHGLLARPLPAGYRRDVFERAIPQGDRELVMRRLAEWSGHTAAGIARWPEQPPVVVGETLAMAIPVGPVATTATARIVEVIDEPRRGGFAYATLAHHPVSGEESFVVEGDDELRIVVTAVWRPAVLAAAVAPPITRWLQRRAINRYLAGIASELGSSSSASLP